MKKFISLIAIILVLAMTVLSFSSCANLFISEAALASISERILEGVNKISSATALDMDMTINAGFSFSGFSFLSIVVPVDIQAQFNVADENNPSAYFSMNTEIDTAALQGFNLAGASDLCSNPNMNSAFYYFDGAIYSSMNIADESMKTKMTADFDGFSKITSMSLDGMQRLVFFDETMIKSASLHNGFDGSLTAKVTVDGEKALKSMLVVMSGMFGSESESLSDSEISSLLAESGLSIGDTKVSLTVDKDNNVTNFKMDSNVSFGYIAENMSFDANISVDANFNPVGDDFQVNTPDDPESYIEDKDFENDNKGKDNGTIDFDGKIIYPDGGTINFGDGTIDFDGEVIYADDSMAIYQSGENIRIVQTDKNGKETRTILIHGDSTNLFLNSDGSPTQALLDLINSMPSS